MPDKFYRQHHNAIAKDIREELTVWTDMYEAETKVTEKALIRVGIKAITELMLRFAKRFQKDNERFDPLMFLDQCSPNEDLYPLSELWEGYIGN